MEVNSAAEDNNFPKFQHLRKHASNPKLERLKPETDGRRGRSMSQSGQVAIGEEKQ